jgi:tRNA(Ile)-lysidine synthase
MSELNPAYLVNRLQLHSDSHIVLALSGGLDSMVLLDILAKTRQLQPFSLQAVYVHHGISAFAGEWGTFCAEQCAKRNVRFCQVKVELNGSDNLESKARAARYQALAQFVSSDKHQLLTAHHSDDQLESLLLALKRGAGGDGLAGIAATRTFAAGKLQRPLLSFSRESLEHYAAAAQLSWVEDDSNRDLRFERNFIRQKVSPVLTERWPHFSRTVSRSMQHVAQLQQLADFYTQQALRHCVRHNSLWLAELAKLHPLQQDLVLRAWLKRFDLNPEQQWLATLKQQVIAARNDATPILQLAGYQVRRYANTLHLLTLAQTIAPAVSLQWHAEKVIALPEPCGSLYFSAEKMTDAQPVSGQRGSIEFGKLSLRFKPAGATMSKPLKQWFKLWQVPPWQRLQVPLLLVDGEVEAVAGFASSITPEQAGLWLSWQY